MPATAIIKMAMPAYVWMFVGVTPNNTDAKTRVPAIPPRTPIRMPATTIFDGTASNSHIRHRYAAVQLRSAATPFRKKSAPDSQNSSVERGHRQIRRTRPSRDPTPVDLCDPNRSTRWIPADPALYKEEAAATPPQPAKKVAVAPPIPRARVITATKAKPGRRIRERTAKRRSCSKPVTMNSLDMFLTTLPARFKKVTVRLVRPRMITIGVLGHRFADVRNVCYSSR